MKTAKIFDEQDVIRTKKEIRDFRELQYSWHDIGSHYELSAMIVWKFFEKGYIPERNDIRKKLGLVKIDYAPTCSICNDTHIHKHNEKVYDPAIQDVKPLKPVSKPRKPRPARISINKRNMASAARTIINNLDANKVRELVAILKEA